MSGLSKGARQAILARDGWQCVTCGSDENLEVDHIRPTYVGGSDEPDNLQTLCRKCHRQKSSEDSRRAPYNAELVKRIREGKGMKSGFPKVWFVLIILVLAIVVIGGLAL